MFFRLWVDFSRRAQMLADLRFIDEKIQTFIILMSTLQGNNQRQLIGGPQIKSPGPLSKPWQRRKAFDWIYHRIYHKCRDLPTKFNARRHHRVTAAATSHDAKKFDEQIKQLEHNSSSSNSNSTNYNNRDRPLRVTRNSNGRRVEQVARQQVVFNHGNPLDPQLESH